MRWTSGSLHASSQPRAPTRSTASGSLAPEATAALAVLRGHLGLDLLEDRREQLALVGELVVERAARDAGRAHDLLGADACEPALGEEGPGGGDQRGAGGLGAFGVLVPLDIHTVCIHYAYSLYAKLDDREDDMPQITLSQGTIHYRDAGEGPPVVFLHGLLVDGEVWRKVTPLLQGDARCIVPDLPLGSHRIAMNADADLAPAGVARLVADLLEALDLEDVTLVGNDTGGAISQLVALDHRERVGRLVLTNCDCFDDFPPKEFVPDGQGGARAGRALCRRCSRCAPPRRGGSPMAYGWLAHEIPDEVTGAWIRPFLDDADIRRDAAAFMRGDRQGDDARRRAAPAVAGDPVARRLGAGRSLLPARAGRAPGGGARRPRSRRSPARAPSSAEDEPEALADAHPRASCASGAAQQAA